MTRYIIASSICALALTGCMTAAQSDRATAFNACKSAGSTSEQSACRDRQIARLQEARADRVADWAAEQQACEKRREEAAALGGEAAKDAVVCQGESPATLLGH